MVVFGLPKHRVGLVVGKGGETIRSLEQRFTVIINIEETDICRLIIEGSDSAVQKTSAEVERLIGTRLVTASEEIETLVIDIPSQFYGKLIGRGGSEKQRIEGEVGCCFSLPSKTSNGTEVIIEGSSTACNRMHRTIEDLLHNKFPVKARSKFLVGTETINLLQEINEAVFFPDSDETAGLKVMLKYLRSCVESLDICVFSITHDRITRAILGVCGRGVPVRIITDKSQTETLGSDIEELRQKGCAVKFGNAPDLMHHKFAVLDKRVIINGSLNWTRAAITANCENIIITSDHKFVSKFSTHFSIMWKAIP
eukprot:c26257_g1_i1.p1 GENE.c26257_g1_i1~~c26257_g1_i1.p1  ORF type:complete len:311 (-),score=55.35 c26257_g1_i1:43-975(-)